MYKKIILLSIVVISFFLVLFKVDLFYKNKNNNILSKGFLAISTVEAFTGDANQLKPYLQLMGIESIAAYRFECEELKGNLKITYEIYENGIFKESKNIMLIEAGEKLDPKEKRVISIVKDKDDPNKLFFYIVKTDESDGFVATTMSPFTKTVEKGAQGGCTLITPQSVLPGEEIEIFGFGMNNKPSLRMSDSDTKINEYIRGCDWGIVIKVIYDKDIENE